LLSIAVAAVIPLVLALVMPLVIPLVLVLEMPLEIPLVLVLEMLLVLVTPLSLLLSPQGSVVISECSGRGLCDRVTGMIPYSIAQYSAAAVQYNTIQYDTIQYDTIRYNTVQYSDKKNYHEQRTSGFVIRLCCGFFNILASVVWLSNVIF